YTLQQLALEILRNVFFGCINCFLGSCRANWMKRNSFNYLMLIFCMTGAKRHKLRKLIYDTIINPLRVFLKQFPSPVGNYKVRTAGPFESLCFGEISSCSMNTICQQSLFAGWNKLRPLLFR